MTRCAAYMELPDVPGADHDLELQILAPRPVRPRPRLSSWPRTTTRNWPRSNMISFAVLPLRVAVRLGQSAPAHLALVLQACLGSDLVGVSAAPVFVDGYPGRAAALESGRL